jgi:2-dehydropantoate 2-reductase
MRFTIVGAGAIGGTVGAYMSRGGEDVELVDQAADHVDAMRGRGLSIRGFEESFVTPVRALHPVEVRGPLQVVLLAVKAQHTRQAVEWMVPLLGTDSAIVSLQNGLCEEIIADVAGWERTVGAFVNFNADYLEPGLIHFGGRGAFCIGEPEGRVSDRVDEIAHALRHFMPVTRTDNIGGYLWAKLGWAAVLYATALVDEPMADVIDRNRPLMVELACETDEVAGREGVRLESFDGVEPDLFYPRERQDWQAIDAALSRAGALMRGSEKQKTGVWRDLAVRRRKTEVDFHLGAAVQVGNRHGAAMPLTSKVVTMIHEIEDGRRSMAGSNIDELDSIRQARAAPA